MKQCIVFYKHIFFTLTCFQLLSHTLFAQSIDLDPAARTVDGITNIAASIVADSFVPMTHYSNTVLPFQLQRQ